MATEVLMPKLGAAMENGTIIKWFKNEGEFIEAGDPLLEVMTDKINIEVEANVSGTLLKINCVEEETVPVNQVVGYIGDANEKVAGFVQKQRVSNFAANKSMHEANEVDASCYEGKTDHLENKVRRTPAARKLANLLGVNLQHVKGSGFNGRIHRSDVEKFVDALKQQSKTTPLAQKVAKENQVDLTQIAGTGVQGKILRNDVVKNIVRNKEAQEESNPAKSLKMEGIRKVIAQRMTQSANTAPHVTIVSEVDMTEGIALRNQLLPIVKKQTGYRLSYTEIIVKAVALSLRKHPMINASLQGDNIILHPEINIGLAVNAPSGLIVPVVRNADQKGFAKLTEECKEVGSLARNGKLSVDQMAGGTFTISNLGMYAVDAFTPIINQPESAILGVGRIHEKPVGVNGSIELRPMMTLSLSFDHRIIDGAPAAAFLTDLKTILENPYQMMI
ncbi:dihydrolipoamide acetyltransferase family protein [Neobacillus drentensis]|uniref:dihydrolipoamide acetyltransferase family protein n=1 Tax=Neobacillus drentensis TaxID=220684 RepID=UPI003003640D